MKPFKLLLLAFTVCFFTSCDDDDKNGEFVSYNVAIPITQSLADFRTSVAIEDPKPIEQAGKIYAYENYLFVNDKFQGIHIIDNSNPENPVKLSYLKIPRNEDVAVKNNILYADSGIDLVVFDISNITAISQLNRVEAVFPNYSEAIPEGADFIDYSAFNVEEDVIVDFTIETRTEFIENHGGGDFANDAPSQTGQGGSLARFNIAGDYLYAVDNSNLNVFDISELSNPQDLGEVSVGWDIETIFNQDDYLYIGSTSGMFIYSIENPANPEFQSQISHVIGCDPVVVKDDLAYVTIRGGNPCGQDLSILEVIDVSDKQNPQVLQQYDMNQPYGLGVKDNLVFVCDKGIGLRVFDATETPLLEEIEVFNVATLDVIPQDDKLIMVSEAAITQYSYNGNSVELLSTFSLE